jgi:hypothetical protein
MGFKKESRKIFGMTGSEMSSLIRDFKDLFGKGKEIKNKFKKLF